MCYRNCSFENYMGDCTLGMRQPPWWAPCQRDDEEREDEEIEEDDAEGE